MITPMQRLVWNLRRWVRDGENSLRTTGKSYNECNASTQAHYTPMNKVFANHSKEDETCPWTTADIAETQQDNATMKHLFKRNAVIDQGLEIKLIENTTCVHKDGQLVIPKPLQVRAVKMVSPLLTAPWTHTSQQDDEHSNVL